MGTYQRLLGILSVQFVGYFSPFFSNSIKSGRRDSLQRIGWRWMDHAQAKIGVVGEKQNKQGRQKGLRSAPGEEVHPSHSYAL